MIISRTPLRISFAGGGTDLREFYSNEWGAVTSTAINKYIYVTVNKKFDDHIRVSYSRTENVEKVDDLRHDLVRESLKLLNIRKGIEITSIADIPSKGTGLGSSSSFTVGLLNALHAYKDENVSEEQLAREACKVEIEIVKEPIGKQDQYAAAYGGLNFIRFHENERVSVEPIIFLHSKKHELESNLMLFYTGITRKASDILHEQRKNTEKKMESLLRMRDLAVELKDSLRKNDLTQFGSLMHKGWLLKKGLASGISNSLIDKYYEKAIRGGALGGKILGAGGGGFLMVYCEKKKQKKVIESLKGLKLVKVRLEPHGSRIIYIESPH